MDGVDTLEVTVVYALAARQSLVTFAVAPGCTIAEAVRRSGLVEDGPGDVPSRLDVGVFGERRHPDDLVHHGDRIEIYRPLRDDPKAIRRRRAEQQDGG